MAELSPLEEEIIDWCNGRSVWIRDLVSRIVQNAEVSDEEINSLAEAIIKDTVVAPQKLTLADIPSSSSTGAKIQLGSIANLNGVNALLKDQTLSFGQTGVTAIYGDNGTGKSGYARLIKEIVGARHQEVVLANAYSQQAASQSAAVTWSSDGVDVISSWPDVDELVLRQVHFYDEACGNDYLVSESELSYRPSVLSVFDTLIQAMDRVRDRFEELIRINDEQCKQLPVLSAGTKASTFLSSLSDKTTEESIEVAVELADGFQDELSAAIAEEARLKATNPVKEKERLLKGSVSLGVLASHLERVESLVGFRASEEILKLRNAAAELRKAADIASKQDFAKEPLSNVGSETWLLLWSAAEEYSKYTAYPEKDFPVTNDGARCVLCQQTLDKESSARLTRFHHFVHDETAKKAKIAESKYAEAVSKVSSLNIITTGSTSALTFLETENNKIAEDLKLKLANAQKAKDLLGKRLRSELEDTFIELDITEVEALRRLSAEVKERAEKINAEQFATKLKIATINRLELEDRNQLAVNKVNISLEVGRLKQRAALSQVKNSINTGTVTKFSTGLARKYVTAAVSDTFVREAKSLKLNHVALGDKGGDKGRIRHIPALMGAVEGSLTVNVLSEGEQTALGLAGLFTEIHFDDTKSAVVLDDPISSLDHDRRGLAAKRIVELAKDRQVIVMTHDLTFLGQIVRETEAQDVSLTERSIERTRKAEPGYILEYYPWKANDARQRFHELEVGLARIKKEESGYENDKYEKETSDWSGRLSETWERIIRSEVAYKVVDRGTSEVRPKMFRILAKISEDDNREFQSSYSLISGWVRRHDKSEEGNYTPPTIDEMSSELLRVREWHKRIQQY